MSEPAKKPTTKLRLKLLPKLELYKIVTNLQNLINDDFITQIKLLDVA